MHKRYRKTSNAGFTLLECLIAIVLVGIAVAALVAANGSFTRVNAQASELSTAEYLIEQIRERSDLLSYNDLYALEVAAPFNPPITADGQVLDDFAAYTQQVIVEDINSSNFENVVTDHSSDFLRVSATILLNGQEITTSRWIRANITD